MDINYDFYRIFYYVAKYRNFTQAANALFLNQPNITRTVKKLENGLGCTLFIRSNRGVTLTPEGEKLYEHIRVAVEQIQAGEEELTLEKGLQSGVVSISATEVALRSFLLPVLKEYQERYPKVKLRLLNHSTPQAITALQSGLADMALVTTPTGSFTSLNIKPVKTVQEVAVGGTAFSELSKKTVHLAELASHPIISLGTKTKTYEFYSQWFLQNGVDFAPCIEASTADQILPMVKNNLGIGFVPRDFLSDAGGGGIFELLLAEPIPTRSVCFVKKNDRVFNLAAKKLEQMILCRRCDCDCD